MKHWLVMVVILLCRITANGQVIASGSCGDNLTWKLTEEYELIIEGWGTMSDYTISGGDVLWHEYCDGIKNVILSQGVTSIGTWAFSGCCNLTAITLPEGVTNIGEGAFSDCSNLATVILPSSLTIIGDYVFRFCGSLTDITLPEGVTSIGDETFWGCSSLTAITLPESVTSIGIAPFASCSSLTSIAVVEGNKVYDSRNGCNAIIETNSNTLIQGCFATIIPEGVTSIGCGAFCACGNLTTIILPSSLTIIGDYVFRFCGSLTDITLPEGVTSIGEYAFSDCCSLSSITFPEKMVSIGRYAFASCSSLTAITLPENVTCIGYGAFGVCSSLTSITCKAITAPVLDGSWVFGQVDKSIPVYVPASSLEVYKSAKYWSEFTNIRPITNEYVLTVSAAGYATMYLDYDAEIPDDVKVYIATSVEGDRLMMTQVTGVLPAETGVIVRAKAGTYTFVESEDTPANVDGNLLSGTATDTYIAAESGYKYYVLAQKNDLVGMYRPKLTGGRFLNNANKAYLALESSNLGIFDDETNTEDEGGQLSNRLRFDFGGTTDIEKTTDNGGQTTVIHDLHGRRIIDTEGLKGVYIVNGRKVIF